MSKTFFDIQKVTFVYHSNYNGLSVSIDGQDCEEVLDRVGYRQFDEEVITPIIDDLCDHCYNSDGEYIGTERVIHRVVEKWADRYFCGFGSRPEYDIEIDGLST